MCLSVIPSGTKSKSTMSGP